MANTNTDEHLTAEPKFALLVDGDNISGDYAKTIMDKASVFGIITIRNVYGNWMNNNLTKWKDAVSEHSLTPREEIPNVSGKNATDIALVIDAMDILYRENVDGFILASSDSDYTALAKRLRASGKPVIGLGGDQTHSSFRNSCTKFINLDLKKPGQAKGNSPQTKVGESQQEGTGLPDPEEIKATIFRLLEEYGSEDNMMILSILKDKLTNRYPDFNPKNYGCSKMSKLLQAWGFKVVSTNSNNYVECPTESPVKKSPAKNQVLTENQLKKEINAILDKEDHADKVIASTIKDDLVKKFPSFKIKDYGCKKMTDLLKKLGFELISDESNKYVVRR